MLNIEDLKIGTYVINTDGDDSCTIGVVDIDMYDGEKCVRWIVGKNKDMTSYISYNNFRIINQKEALAWLI